MSAHDVSKMNIIWAFRVGMIDFSKALELLKSISTQDQE